MGEGLNRKGEGGASVSTRVCTAKIPDAVALAQQLIGFDTVNPPGRERRCAELLADILSDAGFRTALSRMGDDRANLVATRGSRRDRPALVFTGHLDVVPLGTRQWSRDPFGGEIDGGRLYGRGSSDMKSGVAAFVTAAAMEAERIGNGAAVTLIITAGEETGCDGAASLIAQGGLEPAGAIVVAEPTANALCVGHKGALWLKAVTAGVAAHGSMPDQGDNAVYKAARVVNCLCSFSFKGLSHPTLGVPTLSVGTIHGGININSVPDRAEIGIDIRTIPAIDHTELKSTLKCFIEDEIELEPIIDLPGVWTPPDQPWVMLAARHVAAVTGTRLAPGAAPYFTDASLLTPALGRPATVILGPGEPTQAHQTDEWCDIARIGESVEIFRRLIADWPPGAK